MIDQPQNKPTEQPDERPPFFGDSWKGMYMLVLGVLLALIVFFFILTQYYA